MAGRNISLWEQKEPQQSNPGPSRASSMARCGSGHAARRPGCRQAVVDSLHDFTTGQGRAGTVRFQGLEQGSNLCPTNCLCTMGNCSWPA